MNQLNAYRTVICGCLWLLWFTFPARAQQDDPRLLNGGSLLAMAGKDCVALAVDKRFASGMSLVAITPRRVLAVPGTSGRVLVACGGLETDVQSFQLDLKTEVNRLYNGGLAFSGHSNARPPISPRAVASLTSHILYNRKQSSYVLEPLVVGLEEKAIDVLDENSESNDQEGRNRVKRIFKPYLCSMDGIGARSLSKSYACVGAASSSLYGTAESMWRPRMSAEELVEVCGKAFLSALERDSFSGYGAIIYLLTADGMVEYELETRDD